MTPITWMSSGATNKQGLIYTKYKVTTIDNSVLGIKKSTTGTLHAFTCVYADANTAPMNYTKGADFIAYGKMLQLINSGLIANNNQGLNYLKAALGIK